MSGIQLSPEQTAFFDEAGYLEVVDPSVLDLKNDIRKRLLVVAKCIAGKFPEGKELLDKREFSSLAEFVNSIFEVERESRITRAIFEIFASSCELFGVMDHPILISISRQLGIKVPMVWTTPAIRVDRPREARFLSPAHQDIGSSFLSPNGLVFWMALGQLDDETGGVYGMPGSHKKGMLPIVRNDGGYWPMKLADEPAIPDMKMLMPGEDSLIVFGPYFVHQSVPNSSARNVKLTLQLRVNDVDTLPEMTTAFTAKATEYLLRQREKNFVD